MTGARPSLKKMESSWQPFIVQEMISHRKVSYHVLNPFEYLEGEPNAVFDVASIVIFPFVRSGRYKLGKKVSCSTVEF